LRRDVIDRPASQSFRSLVLSRKNVVALKDQQDFLVASIRQNDLRYSIQLFLAWPELWEHFEIGDWTRLFEKMGPRPEVDGWNLSDALLSGEFSDIVFLLRWLEIDAIQFVKDVDLDLHDKRMIAAYCFHRLASGLILSKNTLAGIWDNERELTGRLAVARERLIDASPGLGKKYGTVQELRSNASAFYHSLGE